MVEFQFGGMQHLPRRAPFQFAITPGASVDGIADDRETEVGQMDADLVGAPRFDFDIEEREATEGRGDRVVGYGRFAVWWIGGHPLAVDGMAADRRRNATRPRHGDAMHQRLIDLAHAAILELRRQRVKGSIVLRHDEQSARLLVQPVDDSRPLHAADAAEGAAVVQQRVDQRAARVPRRGMDDQAGGLVENENIGIFKDHIERQSLGVGFSRFGGWQNHDDSLTQAGLGTDAHREAVNRDMARRDQCLQTRAREGGALTCQPDVQALPCSIDS